MSPLFLWYSGQIISNYHKRILIISGRLIKQKSLLGKVDQIINTIQDTIILLVLSRDMTQVFNLVVL